MKAIDELFHSELHSLAPSNDVNLRELQRSYTSSPGMLAAALGMQDAIMKHMKRITTLEGETCTDDIIDPITTDAVMHNLQQHEPECEWIDITDALRGPAYVAKKLIRHCQQKRSKPERQYKFNAEQSECVSLSVSRLEKAFLEREDAS